MSSGTPYIGSKISLISKAGIRYEGFLYTIDTNESTVTLSEVRSFGTEERHSDHPVAPRDEVYNYIIFRGSDISDLCVSEAPKQQSALAQDPAILQHSTSVPGFHPPAPSSFSRAPPPAPFAPFGNVPYGHQYPPPMGGAGGMIPGAHFPGQGHQASVLHDLGRQTPPTRRSPTMEQGVQASENNSSASQKDDHKSGSKTETSSNRAKGGSNNHQRQQQQRKRTSSREDRPPSRDSQQQREREQQQSSHQRDQRNHQQQDNKEREERQSGERTSQGANRERQGSSSNNHPQNRRGRGGRGRNPRTVAGREVPKEDFDFETANDGLDKTLLEEEFQSKLKIVNGDEKKPQPSNEEEKEEVEGEEAHEEPGEVIDEEDPTFYAPEKSFFDSISCEALDRGSRQRTNWKEERKQNLETFGFLYSRGRGRGRGYRGGGYRGGGYRGNYRGGYNNNRGGGGGYNRDYNNRNGRGNYNRGSRDGGRGGGGWKNTNWRDNRDQGDNRNKNNEDNRRAETTES